MDAMLSRQIQEEEQKCFEEDIKQIENKRSHEYHLNQMRNHIIPDPLSQDRYNDDHRPGKCDCHERFEIQNSQGSFKSRPT